MIYLLTLIFFMIGTIIMVTTPHQKLGAAICIFGLAFPFFTTFLGWLKTKLGIKNDDND